MFKKIQKFFTELGKYELKIELVEKPAPPQPSVHDLIKPFTMGHPKDDFKSEIDPERFEAIKEKYKTTSVMDRTDSLVNRALSQDPLKKESVFEKLLKFFSKKN